MLENLIALFLFYLYVPIGSFVFYYSSTKRNDTTFKLIMKLMLAAILCNVAAFVISLFLINSENTGSMMITFFGLPYTWLCAFPLSLLFFLAARKKYGKHLSHAKLILTIIIYSIFAIFMIPALIYSLRFIV